jgi:hypothetical protein
MGRVHRVTIARDSCRYEVSITLAGSSPSSGVVRFRVEGEGT